MYGYAGPCPMCGSGIVAEVPEFSGATVSTTCESCEVQLLLSKSSSGANLRIPKASRREMPKHLVDAVREKLPPRPWPTHIHKSIAADLNVSNSVVSRIIGHLIEQGYFPLTGESGDDQPPNEP